MKVISRIYYIYYNIALLTKLNYLYESIEYEYIFMDPKDGDLCVSRMKSREILMEVRRGSDVQIDPKICIKGRKTNRTIK